LPGLCGTIGSLLVTEAMKLITGTGEPLIGRVLVYDAMRASTREIRFGRDENAPKITELIDYELFCAGDKAPPSITATALIAQLEASSPTLIDVRNPDEREAARIAPSVWVPLPELETGDFVESLAPGTRVTVYCAKGPRSIRATNLLIERGIDAEYLAG